MKKIIKRHNFRSLILVVHYSRIEMMDGGVFQKENPIKEKKFLMQQSESLKRKPA
jgi:hypothetical protein